MELRRLVSEGAREQRLKGFGGFRLQKRGWGLGKSWKRMLLEGLFDAWRARRGRHKQYVTHFVALDDHGLAWTSDVASS